MATIRESHVISIEDLKDPASAHADSVIRSFGRSGVPCGISDIRSMIAAGFKAGADFALSRQWVSVEERLPEDDRYFYFVADARLDPLGVDCAEYTCKTKLFSRNGKVLHPTHWMPIPELKPEKEER